MEKCTMNWRRIRSGPVYIHDSRGIVSLVFEAEIRGDANAAGIVGATKIVGKPAVYVIDDNGVRLVRRRSRIVRAVLTAVATYVLLWAISRLLQCRGTSSP